MTSQDERRRFTRIDFDTAASLQQSAMAMAIPVHIIDISVNGVLIETPDEYSINTEESVNITITLSDDAQIIMNANLVHSSSEVLGFKCNSIDMESATLLRRLIELNMDAENATERVLEELLSRS